jgi:hypothetical protein
MFMTLPTPPTESTPGGAEAALGGGAAPTGRLGGPGEPDGRAASTGGEPVAIGKLLLMARKAGAVEIGGCGGVIWRGFWRSACESLGLRKEGSKGNGER